MPWNELPEKIIYGQQFSPYTKKFHNFLKNYIVNFKGAFSRSDTFVTKEGNNIKKIQSHRRNLQLFLAFITKLLQTFRAGVPRERK